MKLIDSNGIMNGIIYILIVCVYGNWWCKVDVRDIFVNCSFEKKENMD